MRIPMTNSIRVKVKERQLKIFKNYVENTTRNNENKTYYDSAIDMIKKLPDDIERFKQLAKFDEKLEKRGDDAPPVIRFNITDEGLTDTLERYLYNLKLEPTRPMLRELTEMYIDIAEEETNIRMDKYKKELKERLELEFKNVKVSKYRYMEEILIKINKNNKKYTVTLEFAKDSLAPRNYYKVKAEFNNGDVKVKKYADCNLPEIEEFINDIKDLIK